MATVHEISDALGELGIAAAVVPERPNTPTLLNVWVTDDLRPSATLVAPQPDRPGFDNWAWGDNYEHTQPGDADAVTIAQAIADSLRGA